MTLLYGRVLAVVASRGVTTVPEGAFTIQDDGVNGESDPYIATWNTARLGPRPTTADLAAVSEEDAEAAVRTARRTRALAHRGLTALAVAIHRRFRAAVPSDTMTAAQWDAAIQQAWDDLG